MTTNNAIARGNTPHSSTTHSELVGGLTRKFEQELGEMVEEVGAEDFTPARFRRLLGSLGSLLAGIGREAITQMLEDRDAPLLHDNNRNVSVGGRLASSGFVEESMQPAHPAARVVGDTLVVAAIARLNVAAKCGGPARDDSSHDASLGPRHSAAEGPE